MKNDDLKKIVEHPDIPDLGDSARARIVSMAASRYREAARSPQQTSASPASPWLTGALKPALALAACLVVIVAIRLSAPPGIDTAGDPTTDEYNVAVFREYRSLFQHDLRALVAHNGDVEVVLGGQETAQSNPVVFIRVEAEGKPVYITAFSGQTIQTEIGGRQVTMEILTTADKGVLLASDEFMLEGGVLHGPENFHADAHVLETRL